jgi:hypothetical protein
VAGGRSSRALSDPPASGSLSADRVALQLVLRRWQNDTDLAELHDKAALEKLPEEEQCGA